MVKIKITDDLKIQIRAMSDMGVPKSDIALSLGLTNDQVREVFRYNSEDRYKYKHPEEYKERQREYHRRLGRCCKLTEQDERYVERIAQKVYKRVLSLIMEEYDLSSLRKEKEKKVFISHGIGT